MKPTFTIACRGSWLSLAQAEIFKQKIHAVYPDITIEVTIIETSGDIEQSMPLHLAEGKDFFTKEIQDSLKNNQADFAVHSMKDVSSMDFFNEGYHVIIDRDIMNDVAVFNSSVLDKIRNGEKIIIGTSSPRRSNMATGFLQKALPKLTEQPIEVEAIPIRGNVDTRLQKLSNGSYDGIILAAAGLNRLLQYEEAKEKVSELLNDKKLMVLPLFECPPAAGQGAIVAETTDNNTDAITILKAVKNVQLTNAVTEERVYAKQYGYGCSQQFGVFHVDAPNISFTYASGKDGDDKAFTEWNFDTSLNLTGKKLFSSTDFMKDFFTYNYLNDVVIDEGAELYFIASHKAIHSKAIAQKIEHKKVWAAGTRTWYELAKKGIWAEGCADGLGFGFIEPLLQSPLINISNNKVQIITNNKSKIHWIEDGINAIGTYELVPDLSEEIKNIIADADVIFWTSFQQYQLCKSIIKNNVQHVCPAGKTAKLLIAEGLRPIIFPSVKAFNDWRIKNEN